MQSYGQNWGDIVKMIKKIIYLSVAALFVSPLWSASILDAELLAKAEADECFNGVGQPYDSNASLSHCTDIGQPKVNQAYVWGMTKTETHIWFGTVANTLCLVNGTYHQQTTSTLNDSWVCEQNESKYPAYMASITGKAEYTLLGSMGLGDWRVPKIYRYDIATGTNVEVTPSPFTPEGQLILQTLGLRSAGTHNGVVFLAGPGFGGGNMSVNMFAFDAQTGELIGAHSFEQYNNIRKWIVADNELYTAVGVNEAYTFVEGEGNFSGRVLKWEGNVTNPFEFTEVGYLPGSGAELALHEGRLFVTSWPGSELASGAKPAGLYMSPVLPLGGLNTATVWKEIWNAGDYEPDPVVAMTYGGGAVASYEGHLYWGTMHVPLVAMMAASTAYDINTSDTETMIKTVFATNRAISIFRASDFDDVDGAGTIELLYGENVLKKFDLNPISPTFKTFVNSPNKMGQTPLWGASGFGNMYNNYTWTMNVFKDKLYIGTMDWGYLLLEMYPDIENPLVRLQILLDYGIDIQEPNPGADLWRIESSNGPAEAEDTTGVGNYGSYGIRTMVSDDQNLYLGMANPMNLMTDPTDEKPEGGWELIKMSENGGSSGGGSGGSSGGGCTYNPDNKKFDMMMLIMLALSLLYPWRRKFIK